MTTKPEGWDLLDSMEQAGAFEESDDAADYEDDGFDPWDAAWQDCGWDGGTDCDEMGSEHCEVVCPFRDELERNYALSRPRDTKGRFVKVEATS